MPVPTALLANEAGIGRGHIVKLKEIAAGLGPRVQCIAGLARRQFAGELGPYCTEILQAPALHYTQAAMQDPALEGSATWGDYLAAMGLARPDVVRRSLTWWRKQIIDHDASILVADYAPLAMCAAQGLKEQGWAIEIVSVGTGYGVPPAHLPCFPQLLPDYDHVVHPEADVLALINRVRAEQGVAPMAHLPELYRADVTLAATFPFLDPYRNSRPAADRCPPDNTFAPDLAGAGDEVFMYFSTRELQEPAILDAVCALALPRRGFFPGAPAAALARLAASGVLISDVPYSTAEITARSRMVLHSSQHGTICMAALAGLKQMGLPMHLEHVFHGRRAGQQGILDQIESHHRSTAGIIDMAMRVYHDSAMHRRATDFARALRPQTTPDIKAAVAARLAPVVERALAAV